MGASHNVDVEEFEDAPIHKLQNAGDDPGRASPDWKIHGIRSPHELGVGGL